MGKPDALSRRLDHGTGAADNSNVTLLTPGLFAIRALEGLEVFGEEQDILRDIHRSIRDEVPEEPISKAIKELKASKTQTVKTAEWTLLDGLLSFRGRTYVLDYLDLRRRIVSLCHDTRIAGHAGRWKMLELVSKNYWWPQMSKVHRQICVHV